MEHDAPILVTGMHRSGTTWVGRMLAAAPGVGYIDEPLCVGADRGVLDCDVDRWSTYITNENAGDYVEGFARALAFDYSLSASLRRIRGARDLMRTAKHYSVARVNRALSSRPLIKDPFAVFSLPFFQERLGCRIVVVVRHPAAVVASLKRLKWRFDLGELLAQPLLVDQQLGPLRADLQAASQVPLDQVLHWSLLWRAIYSSVASFSNDPGRSIIVRHEDLARDPLGSFESLYSQLGLAFTEDARQAVARSSRRDNPKESSVRRRTASVRLDSLAQLDQWRTRLAPAEVIRIREAVSKVGDAFYPSEAW